MSSTEAEEVAEDYRIALEELQGNNRNEIINLTSIARDYTAHSLKIAEVLQDHILKCGPNKKLPALYVLDSIVKNIGTPYTLYFGKNLFKIFMEAYAVAPAEVRRRMEEMLKTWKQPVAGSLDTRPVFQPTLVQPIENALMKFRQATMGSQGGGIPGRGRMIPGQQPQQRDTPTPPGGRPPYGAPAPYGQNGYGQPGPSQQQHPYHQSQSNTPQQAQNPYAHPITPVQPPQQTPINTASLTQDISNLILAMRAEQAQNPHDASIQTRLKALGDLQTLMQTSTLPIEQLHLVKDKVTELAQITMRNLTASPHGGRSGSQQPQNPYAAPPPAALPVRQSPAPAPAPPAQGSVSLDSLLGPGALAAIMARGRSATPQGSTPAPYQAPPAAAAIRSPQPAQAQPAPAANSAASLLERIRAQQQQATPPAATPPPPSAGGAAALLEQLRARGLLSAGNTPSSTPPAPQAVAPPPPPVAPPAGLASQLPPGIAEMLARQMAKSTPAPQVQGPGIIDIASLKREFNPGMISKLYEQLGPPCTQCGRRFATTPEGKAKKTAHMDWHFRVHSRATEVEKRGTGTHRSWFVDAADWLKSREVVDTDMHADLASSSNSANNLKDGSKSSAASGPKYIPVPEAGQGINNVCPICQDRFENKWLDTAQEWVWLDAVVVGGRAFHASCREEAMGDRREGSVGVEGVGGGRGVLGKRKAEGGLEGKPVRQLKSYA